LFNQPKEETRAAWAGFNTAEEEGRAKIPFVKHTNMPITVRVCNHAH
jgi:hypothetical protein